MIQVPILERLHTITLSGKEATAESSVRRHVLIYVEILGMLATISPSERQCVVQSGNWLHVLS